MKLGHTCLGLQSNQITNANFVIVAWLLDHMFKYFHKNKLTNIKSGSHHFIFHLCKHYKLTHKATEGAKKQKKCTMVLQNLVKSTGISE